ncbi:golgin subfamily A member 6-like protein 6 [Takifugu flavidus]|uniref:golgin subfamily A member 6-like protein 6 n=1 Tax=Takifugu flavidus TaxID=433684 RepID=UPI0025445EB8|nr:golgin subfamily A member 6-like protein 6 [Takifugu flavidus]
MLLFLFSTFASFMSWSTSRSWFLFRGGRGLLPWRHYAQGVRDSNHPVQLNSIETKRKLTDEMASCLVPEFPAVSDALEHLRELDNELREDGMAFSAEASVHLSGMTAAITELEGYRRAAQESLEAEKTANGTLARHIDDAKEAARREITADVAEGRASRAAEVDGLQKHLVDVSQRRDAIEERQKELVRQNGTLHHEKERVEAELEALVAALNDQLSMNKGLQTQLEQSREQTEVLAGGTVRAERDKIQLREQMEVEREALAAARQHLDREVQQVEEEIKQRMEEVRRRRTELGRALGKKQETQEHLRELSSQTATLESSLQRVTESRSRCEKQLEGETQKHQHLKEKKEVLEKDLQESKVTSSSLIQHLSEEISRMESEIEEGQAWRGRHRDSLAQIHQTLKQQQEEERRARAEGFRVVQLLQRSTLQLDQRVACISHHRKEVREMEEQMAALRQAGVLGKRTLERELQEMSTSVEAHGRTIHHFEEERKQLEELLDTGRRKQEAHVAKLTSDIRSARRRYQELLQEEAALQKQQRPGSMDADLLARRLEQRRAKYGEEEARQREEVEQHAADAEGICQGIEEKQRQAEEEEKRLKEAEAMWMEEEVRHRGMERMIEELEKREAELERTLLELKEKTSSLLQPRSELKAQLEDVQRRYMGMVGNQMSELRRAEMSIYECLVKEEQVRLENSRFRLSVTAMTEDVGRAEDDGDRYQEETRLLRQEVRDVLDGLRERWGEDVSVLRDHQRRDGDLLTAMNITRKRLETRREQLENLSTRLEQQVLALSPQLGGGAIPVRSQCLSAGV